MAAQSAFSRRRFLFCSSSSSTLFFLLLLTSSCVAAESFWKRRRGGRQRQAETVVGRGVEGTANNTSSTPLVENQNNVTAANNANHSSVVDDDAVIRTSNNSNKNSKRISILSPATAIYKSFYSKDDEEEKETNYLEESSNNGELFEEEETNDELWSTSRRMTRKRRAFLERISFALSSQQEDAVLMEDHHYYHKNLEEITPQSDLSLPGRHVHIVTTAALPWFTGTAVNPLLRAAYLYRYMASINNNKKKQQQQSWVTLVIPWLELPEDQETLYNGRVFDDCRQQEEYIRNWLRQEAGMPDVADHLEILFYPARYHDGLGSIFAMGDIMETAMNSVGRTLDVCILEEPEHCNWYRAPGDSWTKRFNYVVGIVHTNYREYASAHYSGLWTAPAIALMSSAMVRAYCHKVIRLSDTLQSYAVEKESTSNVHGVRDVFLQEGKRRANLQPVTNETATQVYFIGKLLWAKGLDLMLELEDYYKQYTGDYFPIDVYGSGPDQRAIVRAFHGRRNSVNKTPKEEELIEAADNDESDDDDYLLASSNGTDVSIEEMATVSDKLRFRVKAKQRLAKFKDKINAVELPTTFSELRRQPIPATFPGRVDHGTVKEHKIFLNPSVSEVLCTTTAEALAMGKFAIIPVHPSNTFFLQFPNCLAYRNKFEFIANLRWALTHEPEPLTEEQARQFTWEAATERLVEASAITWREALERERLGMNKLDERIAWLHNELGKGKTGDILRKVLGAGPVSHQVKYQKTAALLSARGEEERDEDEIEDSSDEDDSGFTRKFRDSSFAKAIRATMGDMSYFYL